MLLSNSNPREKCVVHIWQQLMPGWIPRRLGGGLGGRKESGQLRFGGREKPFRALLQPIPYEDLKKLGIPPPPEARYMSRFQVPSLPRKPRGLAEKEEYSHKRSSAEREDCKTPEKGVMWRKNAKMEKGPRIDRSILQTQFLQRGIITTSGVLQTERSTVIPGALQ